MRQALLVLGLGLCGLAFVVPSAFADTTRDTIGDNGFIQVVGGTAKTGELGPAAITFRWDDGLGDWETGTCPWSSATYDRWTISIRSVDGTGRTWSLQGAGETGGQTLSMPIGVYTLLYEFHSTRHRPACDEASAPMDTDTTRNGGIEFTVDDAGPEAAADTGCNFKAASSSQAVLRRAGSARPLREGDTVSRGDRITTGSGRVELRTSDGSLIRIGSNSSLELSDVYCTPTARHFSWKLLAGSIWAHVVRFIGGEQQFDVSADSAATGVRGTTFTVAHVGSRVRVADLEGQVLVRNTLTGRSRLLRAGQSTVVAGRSGPTR